MCSLIPSVLSPFFPRPHATNESRVHRSACRHGMGLECEIQHRQLPICTGYSSTGNPIVELVGWPFILPKTMASGWVFLNLIHVLWILDLEYSLFVEGSCSYRISLYTVDCKWWAQAAALLNHGFLPLLVQLGKIENYWGHLLKEYPNHPAESKRKQSIPLSLYGVLAI